MLLEVCNHPALFFPPELNILNWGEGNDSLKNPGLQDWYGIFWKFSEFFWFQQIQEEKIGGGDCTPEVMSPGISLLNLG